MSDEEFWVTDEDASSSDDSQESLPHLDNESESSSYSYVEQSQGDPRFFHHAGCNDPKHVRALNREIKSHTQLLSMMISTLGGYYRDRYLHLKDTEDLDQCIKYLSHALVLSSDSTMDVSSLEYDLIILSESHHDRFHLSGSSEDLDMEIKYRKRVLSLKKPNHPDSVAALCHAYSSRYRSLENPDDLDQAIEYGVLAISSADGDKQGSLARLDILNEAYVLRSQSSCTMDEIDNGISHGKLAVSLTPDGDAQLPRRLMILSMLHCKAFYHRGYPTDLDNCIDRATRSISIMPVDHPHLSDQINNLGAAYRLRFDRLKEVSDLEAAINCGARALTLTPDDHRSQYITLSNLSSSSLLLFQSQGKVEDLERGIESSARAFSLITHGFLTVTGWELESNRLDTLGGLYFARFEHLENLEDLECALECCKLAVSLAPSEKRHLVANSLGNIGQYIHTRWHLMGDTKDLEQDIDYKTRALSLAATDRHPNLPTQLSSLGLSHIAALHIADSESSDHYSTIRHALDYFQQACYSVGPPLEKLKAARRWAYYARENGMPESLDAYQVAMDLIPQVIWLGTTINRRYAEMKELSTLATEATSAAIAAHDYEKALEWLEQGRSIIMNQIVRLRSPLGPLRSKHPALADKLQKIAQELQETSLKSEELLPLNPFEVMTASISNTEQTSHRHWRRQLTKEYEDLVSEVRQLPGHENFLMPKKATELIATAKTGPVVIINSYDCCRCDALIVQPGIPKVVHFELSSFTCQTALELKNMIGSSLTRTKTVERDVQRRPVPPGETTHVEHVLAILWKDIVKPILDHLGYKPNPPASELPHITWYVTGELSSLPIHAAGIYQNPKSCVFDYAISSYAPSLTALLATRSDFILPVAHSNILTIGQEETPGHTRLPGTVLELAYIHRHTGNKIAYTELTKNKATKNAVLNAMERHDWVHLACHAHQSVGDPTDSGFFLHNDTLDLASVMGRSFKNKGLAFLSACQTAMGDQKLPDEMVHLASGMLAAGYPSVIATMWSVWDQDAPFVADKVYGYLLKDGKMNHQESARALHYAVLELRKEVKDESFERWVPFVHIGS